MKPGPVHVDALVDWLVCAQQCVPGKAHLGLNLTIGPPAASVQPVGALGQALSLLPKPVPATDSVTVTGGAKEFVVALKTGARESDVEFYPYDPDLIANSADQQVEALPDGLRVRISRAEDLTKLPAQLHGLLKLSDTVAYEFTAAVTPGEVAALPKTAKTQAPGVTTISAIGLAFIGGIILNLMPCVFPVLFLKGLALVQSSGEERKQLRSHGLVYTLGILVSFWVIVGVLLVLRAGGSQAGWGFQLQSPTFIAILASFLFFFALSLAGMFDLGLSLTSAGGSLAAKQGYTGSFFTGILATVVATPCTAPLMGAAIGFALVQPAWITFCYFHGAWARVGYAIFVTEFPTRVDEDPSASRSVDGSAQAIDGGAAVRDGDLAGLCVWADFMPEAQLADPQTGATASTAFRSCLGCFLVLAVAGWVLGTVASKVVKRDCCDRADRVGARSAFVSAEGHEPRLVTLLASVARCRAEVRQRGVYRLHGRVVPELPGK